MDEGLWTCRAWGEERLVIKEDHIYAWRQSEVEGKPEANGLGVFE